MVFETLLEKIATMNPALASEIQKNLWIFPLMILQIIMKLVFYPWALYKAAERKQKSWFVVLMLAFIGLNDFGLLPILYLYLNRENKQITSKGKKTKKKL